MNTKERFIPFDSSFIIHHSSLSRSTLHLGDDLLADAARRFLVPVEVHRVSCAALGHRAHIRRVSEHLGKRNQSRDDLRSGPCGHALDPSTPRVDITGDRAHVFFWRDNLHLHDRLEQNGISFLSRVLESHGAGYLERHLRGVNLVIAAVMQCRLDVNHLVPGKNAAFHRFFDTFADGLDVLAGDDSPYDRVHKLVPGARFCGLNPDLSMPVLAASAGLPNKLANPFCGLADSFPIGNLRTPNIRINTKLSLEAIDDDLQM